MPALTPVDDLEAALRVETHYDGRRISCFAERPGSVDQLLRDASARAPDRPAVIDGALSISYRELDRAATLIAANVHSHGLSPGDRLALLIPNRIEFVQCLFGAVRAGLIAVPMSIRQSAPETAFVLAQSGARGLVYDASLTRQLPALDTGDIGDRVYAIDGRTHRPFDVLLHEPAHLSAPVPLIEDDAWCLLYTSGTTGQPKGAILTHLGAVHSTIAFEQVMRLRDGEVSVLAVPASHVTGLIAVLLTMLRVAGTSVMMRSFQARAFLDLAATHRMTHALIVPAMYNLCLMEPEFQAIDLRHWRTGGFGGAPMPETTIERLAETLPALTLINAYGATESTSPLTIMPPGDIAEHRLSVGKAVPGAELTVMDDDGRPVAAGISGEIWARGAMIVPGYWDNPEANRTAFAAGWWKSGDIGMIDAGGYVHLLDRKKDMINRGGYKIYSIEVENVLAQQPGVVECAVVGWPDPVLGERVHAFIVGREPFVTEAALKAACARELSDYKVPEAITLLDTPLPRNANGKVMKAALRARPASATSP